MKNSSIVIGVIILALVALITVVGVISYTPAPTIIQGQVEATEVRVAVKVAGRVFKKHINLGQQVTKGQLLLELESPELDAKWVQVTAVSDAAKAQEEKALKGAREEQIQAAYSVLKKAEAAKELAQKTYLRISNLHAEGVVPTQKLDEAKTQLDVALLNVEAAQANYKMAMDATRMEDKKAAKALVNQANGALAEVEAYRNETTIVAPISGEIGTINVEYGELLTPGFPAVSIVDLNDCWVTFYIREDMLSKFYMGKRFDAVFPALGNKSLQLEVTYIKPEADFATWRTTKATGSFDLRTFEIRAIPVTATEKLRPGMSAIVTWDTL